MPVITMASSKGGSGKSTLAVILAGAFAADDYKVHIIDADRAGRLIDWAKGDYRPQNITVSAADEDTIQDEIARAKKDGADIVLVDVEGTANLTIAWAAGASDLVLIPANPSTQDVTDALKTQRLLHRSAQNGARQIPHALVWSRVPSVRSRDMAQLEAQVAEAGLSIIGSVFERTAYKAMFSYQTTLDRMDPKEVPALDKSAREAGQLALNAVAFIKSQKAAA